jgi:hypothetical protein
MAAFKKGDKVAWDHEFSTPHAEGSIIRPDAVPDGVKIGVVEGAANDEGTYFSVKFSGRKSADVLTHEELVKVAD